MVFGFGPNGMSKLKKKTTQTHIAKMERYKLKKKKNSDVKLYLAVAVAIAVAFKSNANALMYGLLALEPQNYAAHYQTNASK